MDLHGQGDHLTLLRASEHLRLLDGFAGLLSRREEVRRAHASITQLRSAIDDFEQDVRERARRLDLVRYQVEEIDSGKLVPGEDDELRQARSVLTNAERLANGIDDIRSRVSDGEGVPALENLARAATALADLSRIDRLDRSALSLSGGQQQRLCLARTLAVEPEVILMDEPTSALDPIATLRIEELLLNLRGDVTMIVVTHNMQQAARVSDQTAFMLMGEGRAGELVESAPTAQLFSKPRDRRTEDYITGRFG